jgi:hypothetical protein
MHILSLLFDPLKLLNAGLGGFVACRALSQRNSDPAKASRPWDVVSSCKFKNTNYYLWTKLLIYYMLVIHLSVMLVFCSVFLCC